VGYLSFLKKFRRRPTLPHGRPCSTIGAGGLNFRVRDGIGWNPSALTTGNLSIWLLNNHEKSAQPASLVRLCSVKLHANPIPRYVVRTGVEPKSKLKPHDQLVPVS
jgi:hypothetical protein